MVTGIDIVKISRIDDMVKKHEQSLSRFFTTHELTYCQKKDGYAVDSLAGIFAAKEAFFKALGTGFREGKWSDVEILHDSWGAPYFKLKGYYAQTARARSSVDPSLSISHDGDYAIAYVVWELKL